MTMFDLRRLTFVALSSAILLGTIYSVAFHTWLDTSDPLVALNHTKHHLHETSYFARKDSLLNTLFIKRAWGWTTAAFLALFLTYPQARFAGARGMSTRERLSKWAAATGVWLVFAAWFFGPSLMNRIESLTGAECVVRLPSGKLHTVPADYCYDRTILSPATHPDLFFIPPLLLPESGLSDWRSRPRLSRGHDVSGHVFILTLSLLFLADMIRPSLALPSSLRSSAHDYALLGTVTLMSIWLFSEFITSLYFHSPAEKLSGYLIGLAGFLVTQLPFFQDPLPEILEAHVHED